MNTLIVSYIEFLSIFRRDGYTGIKEEAVFTVREPRGGV